MIEALLQKVRDETNKYAMLQRVKCELVPELLTELEVVGWNLKALIPHGDYAVTLLLKRNT